MMVAAVSKKVYISWNTFPATSGSANLIRIGELVEPLVNGPFDFAQGSWAKALPLRCRYLS